MLLSRSFLSSAVLTILSFPVFYVINLTQFNFQFFIVVHVHIAECSVARSLSSFLNDFCWIFVSSFLFNMKNFKTPFFLHLSSFFVRFYIIFSFYFYFWLSLQNRDRQTLIIYHVYLSLLHSSFRLFWSKNVTKANFER